MYWTRLAPSGWLAASISAELRPAYAAQNREGTARSAGGVRQQAQLGKDHADPGRSTRPQNADNLEIRGHCSSSIDWALRLFEICRLTELVPYIDWSPFFHAWELRGTYPDIFKDPYVGDKAKEVYDDAAKLLLEKSLTAS